MKRSLATRKAAERGPVAPPPATDADQAAPAPDPRTLESVRAAVAAARDKKAEELRVQHLGAVTTFTDYFLICSGQNTRQVQAIADGIEEALRARKVKPLHTEGYPSGQWVLLDYGDLVCHVFLHERRHFYGLERLWSDAPDVTALAGGAAE